MDFEWSKTVATIKENLEKIAVWEPQFTKIKCYINWYYWQFYDPTVSPSRSKAKPISKAAYEEVVIFGCRKNTVNQKGLLNACVRFHDLDEAAYWVETLNIQKEIPWQVKNYIANLKEQNKKYKRQTQPLKTPGPFHPMDKSKEIIKVDSDEKVQNMIKDVQNYVFVGLDVECNAFIGGVALIQISTDDRVYLVECLAENISAQYWKKLATEIFNNIKITLMGEYPK